MHAYDVCQHIFRAFGLDPYVAGRPYTSALLYAYSLFTIGTPIGLLVYMFAVVHIIAEPSMLTMISAAFVSFLLGTQSLLVVHAIRQWHGPAAVRHRLDAVDELLATTPPRSIGPALVRKLGGMMAVNVAVYGHYVLRFGRSSTVLYILLSMATIKVRGLQSVFYVDQIGERLERIAGLLHGLTDGTATRVTDVYGCYERLMVAKRAYGLTWLVSASLNDGLGWSWLVMAVETLEEVVVNVYLISSALFTGAVPMRAITLSLYGVVPTLLTFALFCWSCEQCTQRVSGCCHSMRVVRSALTQWCDAVSTGCTAGRTLGRPSCIAIRERCAAGVRAANAACAIRVQRLRILRHQSAVADDSMPGESSVQYPCKCIVLFRFPDACRHRGEYIGAHPVPGGRNGGQQENLHIKSGRQILRRHRLHP